MNRDEIFNGLARRPNPDVLVIGGGINGISVFRELALQGVDVLLVERSDYCSGASAALSRMVHGGLRYLENGEFKLVKESLEERDRLLANAPHYVSPLMTTVPVFDVFSGVANGAVRFLGLSRRPSRRGAVVVKLGLSIYDFLTRRRAAMPGHSFRGRRRTFGLWPALNPDLIGSATYYDAQVSHPERLGIELLKDGLQAGVHARALNYAEVRRGAQGLVLHDGVTGRSTAIAPRIVVNATGGWIDLTNRGILPDDAVPAPLMGGTKGSHLMIDNPDLLEALGGHMLYYENEDGRICILFPYLGKVLVGSTDIRVDDPGTVRCEADERDYILQSLAFVLPDIKIAPEQIVYQFAGVRPLPASEDSFTGRIPRDHFCTVVETVGSPPVLCMIGGKWTTFRSFGELASTMVLERLGRHARVETAERAIGGGRSYPAVARPWKKALAARTGLSLSRVDGLFSLYGTDAAEVAAFIAEGADSGLADSAHSVRECIHLIREEAVEHLDDLLLRRTTLGVSGQLSLDTVDAVLDILADERGWSDVEKVAERRRFLTLLAECHGVGEAMLKSRNTDRSVPCATTAR
ncbi:MAG: glycerol-3-phosphate dehydrogenase/oxidase [Rhizobium sp.]|nr:glycerol-3-phosphate dehydrogenase/oxidase [Rhizobium sp.]